MGEVPILGQKKDDPRKDPKPELPVTTAFVVIVDRDGSVTLSYDLDPPVVADRQATPDDILGAVAAVRSDVESHITAMKVQQVMMMTSQALMQQQQEQALRSRLKL